MPVSWCQPIMISSDLVQKRFPMGQKILQFSKCTISRYSPYFPSANGLVRKLELFADQNKQNLLEMHEFFLYRRDNLVERHSFPTEGKVHQHYSAGRSKGLKDWIEIQQAGKPVHRIFEFYPGSRIDGLVKREEIIGKKIMEFFSGRDNLLNYRSVSVDDVSKSSSVMVQFGDVELPVRKFSEKYDRNPDVSSEMDIRKITFFSLENKIRLDFHYGEDRVTASCRTYSKDNSDASGWTVDELARKPTRSELKVEFQSLIAREKDTITKIREHERTAFDLLQMLKRESIEIFVDKTVYDMARDKAVLVWCIFTSYF